MSFRAAAGFALLVVTAACAGRTGVSTRPINPDNGPNATIRATMSGPAVYRQLEANFRLDEAGYVVVGHLGGDGMVRVVYPSLPGDQQRLAAHTWVRTDPFDAPYDFAPQRYTFASEPIRSSSAAFDSYDGRGHGYIFVVTSYQPLNMEALMDGFEFGELDVQNYGSMFDPRVAVQRIADAVAGRGHYTLKFANSFSTYDYASASYGPRSSCSPAFSQLFLGYDYYMDVTSLFWSAWGMPMWHVAPWHHQSFLNRCGSRYAFGYGGYYRGYDAYPWRAGPPVQTGSVPPATTPPTVTPILTRLRPTVGGRPADADGRSAIDRHTMVTRTRATEETLERIMRPRNHGFAATPRDPVTRTHATSFDRPGPTRVFDDTPARRRATYTRDNRPASRDNFREWMREPRSTPQSSGSSSAPSSSSPAASSGSSSTSSSAKKGSAGGSQGSTPKKP